MSALTKITDSVYWMPPGPPDRPSLCGIVGERRTLMLDAGSSAAHTRSFLDALLGASGRRPSAVVYTHSHWDHVLGGVELGGIVIAHALTAKGLIELANRDWSDEGLARRVAEGRSSAEHAAAVKAEMPSPRAVEVAPADVIFHDEIELDLGGVTVRVRHVGGDHSADSCVIYVEPDRVLFMGDCLSASPEGVMLFPINRLDDDEPQIIFDGSPKEIVESKDKRVTQFVRGEAGERLVEMQEQAVSY